MERSPFGSIITEKCEIMLWKSLRLVIDLTMARVTRTPAKMGMTTVRNCAANGPCGTVNERSTTQQVRSTRNFQCHCDLRVFHGHSSLLLHHGLLIFFLFLDVLALDYDRCYDRRSEMAQFPKGSTTS
jgi:hypothetical protein